MKKSDAKFLELYKRLNPEQKHAVDSIEGPVMVVAGPGTGKTQILTLRIANILRKTDIPPDAILALTFTEAARFNMRKRLLEIIGPAAYRVTIFTFHSFANSIIQAYPEHFPNIIGASNINIIDQIKILERIIDTTKLEYLKPFGNTYYYLRPLLSLISKLKRENISVPEFKKKISLEHDKYEEAHLVYRLYQEELRKNFLYDYDDMIVEVISVLKKDKKLLLELQENYQYILADEHQDANQAQNTLLELLTSFYESPNLFIVGDEKQAIFRFQGASLDNFNYFKSRFKGTKIITLVTNYRSDQFILDASFSLIGQDKLLGHRVSKLGKIKVVVYPKVEDEARAITEQIGKLIKSKVSPSEIAVLYRDNKDALPILSALERTKIPFVIESDQDILADPDIRKLILLMRVVNEPLNAELFARVLHVDFFGIDSVEIYKFVRNEGVSEAILGLKKQIATWRKTAANIDLVTFFEILVRESGFLKYVLSSKTSVEKMEKLDTLFDEIKRLVENHRHYSLEDFLEYIDLIEEHNILLKKDKAGLSTPSVRLMTAHRAKGQEFEYVFISGVSDGHWGNRMSRDALRPDFLDWPGSDEDERRLFYVALTRAKKGIFISYHSQSRDGKSLLPSQFIHEIDPVLLEEINTRPRGSGMEWQYQERKKDGISFSDKKYLKTLFEEREFSVTALNNYLSCPWKYFYSNLVRIPTAISKHQMYGIAIHGALKEFFQKMSTSDVDISRSKNSFGKPVSRSIGGRTAKHLLLNLFETALRRQPLSESDFDRTLKKGVQALGGYFDTYGASMRGVKVLAEMSVKGVALGDIILTGKLDKVEVLKNGHVRVVDYKTGKPKSRNEILGKSGNKSGDMFRQLVFYKLLLDSYEKGKYHMVAGEIDFVEPNDRGYYKKESFEITPADVDELRKTITKAVKEIRSLNFWNKRCDDKKCEYCSLREMMNS